MQEFIDNQNKFNKTIDDRINRIELDTVEHGKRLNAFEKELITMTGKLEKMGTNLDKLHDKIDVNSETLNDFRIKFPEFMNEFVDKNAKRTQEIVTNHQVKCSNDMDNKFLAVPEGWKGYAVRGFLILMAGLLGLDLSGIVPIMSKPATEAPRIASSNFGHSDHHFRLQDVNGNIYILKADIASATQIK